MTAFKAFFIAAAAAVPALWAAGAGAVSLHVKLACSRDYYAYCSQYSSGSPEVRRCMRTAGAKLSPRCLDALVAEGEVSEAEIARRTAQAR